MFGEILGSEKGSPDSVSAANSQLLNVRNAITQLKETLEYENCDINELQKNCLNAFDLINFAISQSKQIPWESENKFECYEHDEERIRDEVALEFLSGVHKQMTAAGLFPWLRNQPDLGSLKLLLRLFYSIAHFLAYEKIEFPCVPTAKIRAEQQVLQTQLSQWHETIRKLKGSSTSLLNHRK